MAEESVTSKKYVSEAEIQSEVNRRLKEALAVEESKKASQDAYLIKHIDEEVKRRIEAERTKNDNSMGWKRDPIHDVMEMVCVAAFKCVIQAVYFLFFNVGFFVLFLWRVMATIWLLHRTSLLFGMKRGVSMWDKPFIWFFSMTHGAEVLMFVLYACLASHKERSKTDNRSFFFWVDLLMTVPSSILLIIHLLADVRIEYGELCIVLCAFAAVAHAFIMLICNLDYAVSNEGHERLQPVYNVLNYMIHHFF